jgi:UDPglucose 6-dehydrogenase
MRIGFIGLGKLGLPCAAAMSVKTNTKIVGYDQNSKVKEYIETNTVPYVEKDIESFLFNSNLEFLNSAEEVIEQSDTIFVAVQTPHDIKFEGITPIPEERSDFDYSYLKDVVITVSSYLEKNKEKHINLVIISTVLPGTISNEILPILKNVKQRVKLTYNPYFIAMGTTIEDFLNPEFILLGSLDGESHEVLEFYKTFSSAPIANVSIESAELTKVAYNTFIGFKIIFANALAEITESIGGNVDEVTDALSLGTKRIISPAYMSAGMGDGGGCHPRDQIAMSWLAQKINMSFDIFEFIAKARDKQTEKHAKYLQSIQSLYYPDTEIVILGESYKKNIGITTGSPSKLLQHYLDELNVKYRVIDPFTRPEEITFDDRKLFFVATPHDAFKKLAMPVRSQVIDPWGDSTTPQYGVMGTNLGRGRFWYANSLEVEQVLDKIEKGLL